MRNSGAANNTYKFVPAVEDLARKNYLKFIQAINPNFVFSQHHYLWADLLEQIANGTIPGGKGILLSSAPGTSKSEYFSKAFPPWFFGYFNHMTKGQTDCGVITCSHGKELAALTGEQSREYVNAAPFETIFHGLELSRDTRSKTEWVMRDELTRAELRYFSAGISGAVTGRRAQIAGVDDPIKDLKLARSVTRSMDMYRHYNTVISTRLTGLKGRYVMHTRWGKNDLIGLLWEKQKKEWMYINLPAIAIDEEMYELKNPLYRWEMKQKYGREYFHRKPGDSIWPDHPSDDFALEKLYRIRDMNEQADWLSLYQGMPIVEGGNYLKVSWLQFLDVLPELDWVLFGMDTAWKDKHTSAYTAVELWGKFKGGIILLDVLRGKWLYDELKIKVTAYIQNFMRRFRVREILIEEEASGISLCRDLKTETCLPIVGVSCPVGKLERASLGIGYLNAGRVYIYRGEPLCDKPWLHDFLEEYEQFPEGRYKDQIDVMFHVIKRVFIDGISIYDEGWLDD